ncbi:hypothetical protein BVH03_12135 [Pseudomonas sp. PA15(2017)]|nr:hypothetical protein BVH03_12135 [Pseudomonas sp. PA15(2017)]
MSFNHYYRSELTVLRQLGRRFAERSPVSAPFLGQTGCDLDGPKTIAVRGLIQRISRLGVLQKRTQ